ncbi:class F sortase [Spongiactinospora sp. TRM90649]|uniref:class F sortase n=1 Tax=Spongiactinospora sp. TRM90649 TaxID=3031114 RepID=UPI0023F8B27F|nr:class F sortase [Spongiactinospora sp. TRM90649]MDF5757695.1 class F sortase [Spongiactinospora sp. TRM90649]
MRISPGEALFKAAACAFFVAGAALAVDAVGNRDYAPPPVPEQQRQEEEVVAEPGPGARVAVLRRSVPVHLSIPAIGVSAPIEPVGRGWGGTIAVPSVHEPNLVGWYEEGATPGERGPATLLGHVDTASSGPAVFYGLGRLRPGDEVKIRREDGSLAAFEVNAVRVYAKTAFPARQVYGPTPAPTLRLVTCGGRYDPAGREYLDNIVAFAHAVPAHGVSRR